MKIGLAQIDIQLGEPQRNLETVSIMVEQAAAESCELLILPELWGSGYDLARATELSSSINEGLFQATSELAYKHKIAICGSLLETTASGIYNTATIYDHQGTQQHHYRKTHLIGLMQEDDYLQPGQQAKIQPELWGGTALAICYDLRFPELFRSYALAGAQLMIIPAEWPIQRIEHWRTLLRARAIENQCFMIACNRIGSDRANTFGGASTIIDPWGEIVIEGAATQTLLTATINLEKVTQARTFLPVFTDRRPEVYNQKV